MDSDYGLRKRSTAPVERKAAEVNRPLTVWERFPTNSGFKSLGVAEVQSDLKGILAGMDPEASEEEVQVEEKIDKGKAPKATRGRKRKRKGGAGRRSKALEASANFYYAYKRTKSYEEELEYSQFVSEQQYLSVRHAYTKKLENVMSNTKRRKAVIDILRKKLEDKLNGTSGLASLDQTSSLLQKALNLVGYHESRAASLESQNKDLRQRLAANEEVTMDTAPDLKESEGKPKGAQDTGDLPDIFVNTTFGPGTVVNLRTDSLVSVKLDWGAVATIPISSLCPVSSELVERHKDKQETEHDASVESSEKEKDLVPLDTVWRTGPPRGVELYLSPLSSDPHFALHPALPSDPHQIEKFYKTNEDMTQYAFGGGINGHVGPSRRLQATHGDWDETALGRIQAMKDMPCSWTESSSSPWADEGKGLARTELGVWQEEHIKHLEDQATLRRMQHELQRLRAVVKIRDKRLLAARENQKYLINRLTSSRNKYTDLNLRHVRLLKAQTDKPNANGKSNGTDETQSNGTLMNGVSGEHSNEEAQEDENEDTKNESDTSSRRSNTRKRARSVDALNKDTDSYGRRISTRRQKKKA